MKSDYKFQRLYVKLLALLRGRIWATAIHRECGPLSRGDG